jgi:ribosomal protein L7Ae-like RNA K-turn-binding protein
VTEQFVRTQVERAKQMNDESNMLLEKYNIIKRAGKMIYGENQMIKAIESNELKGIGSALPSPVY